MTTPNQTETSISVEAYAQLIGKTSRTVNRWIADGDDLPPPALRVFAGKGRSRMIVVPLAVVR